MKPIIVGIAGGSGSGKSTFADRLSVCFAEKCLVIRHDDYYRDRSDLSFEERAALNYDEPAALETELLCSHLRLLKRGDGVVIPEYDFETHLRKPTGREVAAAEIIVVEGILVLAEPTLREMLDIKIFVDTDADIMATRRILRDCKARGRTPEGCFKQYMTSVKPMLEKHVLPSKKYASIIIQGNTPNDEAFAVISSALSNMISI